MDAASTLIPAGEALAEIERVLDRIDPDRSNLDGATRLAWVGVARRVRGRVEAVAGLLTAEADKAQASLRAAGTPMESWLGTQEVLSRREAAGALHQARVLGDHRLVGEAAAAGRVGTGQARAIGRVLDSLAPRLSREQQAQAEQVLVDLAGHLDADQLSRSPARVLEQVAPAEADELLEHKLQREAEAAHRQRSLRFFHDGASVRFDGSLPRVEGERWLSLLDAHGEAQRRTAIEARDPLAEPATPQQRRADALIAMIRAAGGAATVPGAARLLVKVDFERLRAGAAGAGVIGDDQLLSAGELRRLCCDAELIPVVLGSASEVLDVGRAERLVTPAIRAALIARDGGCAFPGCDAPPARCEAHHVVPWYLGGPTALPNLVLLCHRHHPIVEPARFAIRDQWQVRVAKDGLPEFIPPAGLDPHRRPLRHQRRAGPTTAA